MEKKHEKEHVRRYKPVGPPDFTTSFAQLEVNKQVIRMLFGALYVVFLQSSNLATFSCLLQMRSIGFGTGHFQQLPPPFCQGPLQSAPLSIRKCLQLCMACCSNVIMKRIEHDGIGRHSVRYHSGAFATSHARVFCKSYKMFCTVS
eukprot:scaffold168940_cov22-Tisochrysis_lutea.AAC.1